MDKNRIVRFYARFAGGCFAVILIWQTLKLFPNFAAVNWLSLAQYGLMLVLMGGLFLLRRAAALCGAIGLSAVFCGWLFRDPDLYRLLYFLGYAVLVLVLVLSLKKIRLIKGVWFVPALLLAVAFFIMVWNSLSSASAEVPFTLLLLYIFDSLLFFLVCRLLEVLAVLFTDLWARELCGKNAAADAPAPPGP